MSDLNIEDGKIINEILSYLKTHTLRETKKKFSLLIGDLPTYTMSKYSAVYKEINSEKENFLFYLNKNNHSDIVTTWEEATKIKK